MKALITKEENIVKYVGENIDFIDEKTTNAGDFNFGCHGSDDCVIETVADVPADYVGNKYLYVAGTFEINPEYVEPETV